MGYTERLPNVLGDYTSAQSDTSLVAAVSGKRIRVAAIYVMSAVAGEVVIESGGMTAIFVVHPGANGGVQATAPDGQFLCSTSEGESLTVTTDITGAHTVNVLYQVV